MRMKARRVCPNTKIIMVKGKDGKYHRKIECQ